jgi:hypothetical protein
MPSTFFKRCKMFERCHLLSVRIDGYVIQEKFDNLTVDIVKPNIEMWKRSWPTKRKNNKMKDIFHVSVLYVHSDHNIAVCM